MASINENNKSEFDFNKWIQENGLNDIKDIFIKHGMTDINTLSTDSAPFKNFISDDDLHDNHPDLVRIARNAIKAPKTIEQSPMSNFFEDWMME